MPWPLLVLDLAGMALVALGILGLTDAAVPWGDGQAVSWILVAFGIAMVLPLPVVMVVRARRALRGED